MWYEHLLSKGICSPYKNIIVVLENAPVIIMWFDFTAPQVRQIVW